MALWLALWRSRAPTDRWEVGYGCGRGGVPRSHGVDGMDES